MPQSEGMLWNEPAPDEPASELLEDMAIRALRRVRSDQKIRESSMESVDLEVDFVRDLARQNRGR